MKEIKRTWDIDQIIIKPSCVFVREIKDQSTAIGQFYAHDLQKAEAYFEPRDIRQSLKGGRVSLFVNSVVCELLSQYEARFADFNCE